MNTKSIIVTVLIFALAASFSAFGQGQKRKANREKIHSAVKSYVEQNVIPVMKPQREKLDTYLTAQEKAEVEDIRAQFAKLRADMKAKKEAFRQNHKPGERHQPTEAQREEMRETMKLRRQLTTRAWAIVDAHEDDFDAVLDEVKPNMETWRADLKKIFEENRPERPEGKSQDGVQGKKRMHRGGKSAAEGHRGRRGGFGARGGRGMMGGLSAFHQPVKFLLWDPSKSLEDLGTDEEELNVFPNPSQNYNTVKYQVNTPGQVTIRLINEKGDVIKTVLSETKEKGEYSELVDLSNLEKGLYFYQIKTAEGLQTKKIIIDK